MSPGSNTVSYPTFAHIGLRENPGKNLNQFTQLRQQKYQNELVAKLEKNFFPAQAHRIYNRTEHALVRERIHQTRRELAKNDNILYDIHLQLSSTVHDKDWDNIDKITYDAMQSQFLKSTNRHKKFLNLPAKKKSTQKLDTNRTVVNLLEVQLSPEEIAVLAKGGNYAITLHHPPIEDIISNIEAGIRGLPNDETEEIRRETARILQHAKPTKTNLTGKERQALRSLNNKNLIVLAADKGNATVILNL
ncbi:hypothetical protein ANN_14095 [Periplaneta americana]|uniref:Uncharacterized protein n=1 Tax=Periplaneta americana TaxID=6978 RepID=A0ABQ8SWK7_PERAM|nr:hypothetical protein ANN_14095 [Periplaneta americana]